MGVERKARLDELGSDLDVDGAHHRLAHLEALREGRMRHWEQKGARRM